MVLWSCQVFLWREAGLRADITRVSVLLASMGCERSQSWGHLPMNCSPQGWFHCHKWFLGSIVSEVVMGSSLHRPSPRGVHRKMNKKKPFILCVLEKPRVWSTQWRVQCCLVRVG